MKTTFIYELIDPRTNEPRYIGKSNNPKNRLKEHLKDDKKTYKANWIKGLLKEDLKPILNIVEEVPFKEWQFWERYYISLYKSWNFKLTNSMSGGEGYSDPSGLVAKKISNTLKGKKQSEDSINKRKKSRQIFFKEKGYWSKPGTYDKIVQTRKKNGTLNWSKKSKEQQSVKRKKDIKSGKIKFSDKWIEQQKGKKGKDNNAARQIVQYDLNGNFIKVWNYIKLAKLAGFTGDIIGCCIGRCFQSKKFIWRYLNPNLDELPNTLESIKKTLIEIDLRKEFVKNNMKEKQKLSVEVRKNKKMSEDSRKKMSNSKKGKDPWNKGLKGVQTAWNKGKINKSNN